MISYLKNSIVQIKRYESYYNKEFNIDKIRNDILSGELDISLFELFRFRIFLDACVFLFNKEKLEKKYFKNSFDTRNYINSSIRNNYNDIIEYVSSVFPIKNIGDTFYYEWSDLEKMFIPKEPWDSRKILRNAFAHMQYGNFYSEGKGNIIFYFIHNEDKGTIMSEGLVIEGICHELISKFYLNQIVKSVAYKHTFIEFYEEHGYFVEVRYRGKEKYKGNNFSHIMNSSCFSTGDSKSLMNFLRENDEKFKIDRKYICIDEIKMYTEFLNKYLNKCANKEELAYFIKSINDIETEFSNFLTHLIQLNDTLIEYKTKNATNNKDISKVIISLEELKEDSESWLEFKFFFKLLYIINFSLRMEVNNLKDINYADICTDNFVIDIDKMADFINKNNIDKSSKNNGECLYILTKIRNSVLHGRISLDFFDDKVYYVFQDEYYRRYEEIKIAVEDMDKFISEINLYS